MGGQGLEGLSKQEKGLVDMDNTVVISGLGGERGPNGNKKFKILNFYHNR